MPTLSGFCPNGHAIETFIASHDVRPDGSDREVVIAVCSVEDVRCSACGALIDALEEDTSNA